MITLGELLTGRQLYKETVGGLERYRPGQYKSRRFSKHDAILSYVDVHGWVCIIPCVTDGDDWFHRGSLIRVSVDHVFVRPLDRAIPLTDEMIATLNNKKKRAAPSQARD